MSISLTINGTTFNYPASGESPNWAEEASSWSAAVTEALNTLLAPGDILQTSFSIDNNTAVATNVNGLLFDSGTVRAANVNYAIYRTSTSMPSGNAETGIIYLIFDDSAAVGNKWQMTQSTDNAAGVAFSIGDNGQIQYISNDIGTVGYSGTIRFSAKTLAK
jgi:hypothetical protein